MHHRKWYDEAIEKAQHIDVTPHVPQLTGRQTQRNNVPATSPEEYYRRSVTIPFIDHLLEELKSR